MDETLVETNFANFLSYKSAIQKSLGIVFAIPYNPNQRFTRETLKETFPDISSVTTDKIVHLKNQYFNDHLSLTSLIKPSVDILKKFAPTNKTILVTNCREERAISTLQYHALNHLFSFMFFHQEKDNGKNNKFEYALSSLNISAVSVIVFENDPKEIEAALFCGIPRTNIIIC
jgi:FMN phosphatase YigB (HAD superfamily)